MNISPCALAIKALGLRPEGTLTCTEEHATESCAVCGAKLVTGEPIDTLALPPSFTNQSSLADSGGKWRCGACTAVMVRSVFQMGMSTILITGDGVFPIVRKEHRSWLFLTPPEPPFAIAIQNAQQQHVLWRAPVSLSKDLLMIRVGERLVRIRRPHLLAARDAAQHLHSIRKTAGRPVKDGVENPFINEWKMLSQSGGQLKGWAMKLIQDQEKPLPAEHMSRLLSLNAGEAWALTAALFEHPVKPDALTI